LIYLKKIICSAISKANKLDEKSEFQPLFKCFLNFFLEQLVVDENGIFFKAEDANNISLSFNDTLKNSLDCYYYSLEYFIISFKIIILVMIDFIIISIFTNIILVMIDFIIITIHIIIIIVWNIAFNDFIIFIVFYNVLRVFK
jgi:hypothetical protein